MRAAFNTLAEVDPEWLRSFAPDEWYERYEHRVEEYRLPEEQAKRTALVETIGADGYALLDAIDSTPELQWLQHVPAVEILRRVWMQQFELIDCRPHFRANDNIPPPPKMICSPYDIEATYGRKLTTWWVGYKVHLTESCDADSPRLVTHVETSRAGNGDVDVTPVIHQALKQKELLPKEHLTDTNYAEAKQFVQSRQQYGIDLIAPTRADHKWQAKDQQGFDTSRFQIDWDAEIATCPAGCESWLRCKKGGTCRKSRQGWFPNPGRDTNRKDCFRKTEHCPAPDDEISSDSLLEKRWQLSQAPDPR